MMEHEEKNNSDKMINEKFFIIGLDCFYSYKQNPFWIDLKSATYVITFDYEFHMIL